VAYPTKRFDTPSGKVEFESDVARGLGLPALPAYEAPALGASGARDGEPELYPLLLTQGRTLSHFHGFYNNGQVLPTLARRESEPAVWISPDDAAARGVGDGDAIRVFNPRGEFRARAHVTPRIPAGSLWLRDGWPGLNHVTAAAPVLPDEAVDVFGFSAGQASFDARVELVALVPGVAA
jgi:anaerobic selenocysteine-containing dehydrogenase